MNKSGPTTLDENLYGTWCETPDGNLAIIHYTLRWNEAGQEDCWVFVPSAGHTQTAHEIWTSDELVLRPDIPRAWNPDGTPHTKETTHD